MPAERDQQNAALAVSRPHPLWSEQDPDDYWTATQTAVLGIDPAFRARVQGIGIAGQMYGTTDAALPNVRRSN